MRPTMLPVSVYQCNKCMLMFVLRSRVKRKGHAIQYNTIRVGKKQRGLVLFRIYNKDNNITGWKKWAWIDFTHKAFICFLCVPNKTMVKIQAWIDCIASHCFVLFRTIRSVSPSLEGRKISLAIRGRRWRFQWWIQVRRSGECGGCRTRQHGRRRRRSEYVAKHLLCSI